MSFTDQDPGFAPLAVAPTPSAEDAGTSDMPSAPAAIQRPMKIIELDDVPLHQWRIEPNAVYLWNGRLWRKEAVGCVLCVEQEGNGYLTFSSAVQRWATAFVCMQHGELCEVGFEMRKRYEITIDGVFREGEERLNDTMLFPTEMTLIERTALVERLLDEAQEAEAEAGPAPSE